MLFNEMNNSILTYYSPCNKIIAVEGRWNPDYEASCQHRPRARRHRALRAGRDPQWTDHHFRSAAIDPATGAFPEGIQAQTRQSLTNVKAILEAAGSSMDKVVKTTVFLSDMNNFGAMNEVYATFFTEGSYPARSAVEVARLPKDALVEIEVTAAL